MKKKALIVAISDYGGRIPSLETPQREMLEWRDLLVDVYGFAYEDVRLLADDRARKSEIEARFRWLYEGGEQGDQLVFIYCGHGIQLRQRNRDSGELLDNMEEALVTYPVPGELMESIALYDDDLIAMYLAQNLPEGTNATFILECCFGGGFNSRDLPGNPRVMTATPPEDLRHRSYRHPYGSQRQKRDGGAIPLSLNAAGEFNVSVEITIKGERRANFSYHAIEALRANPQITYDELLNQVRGPMREHFAQHPNVRGNQRRRHNAFLF